MQGKVGRWHGSCKCLWSVRPSVPQLKAIVPAVPRMRPARELVAMLSQSLGDRVAEVLVRRVLDDVLGLELDGEISRADALVVLDRIATEEPGLAGISARFLSSRLILDW